MLEKNPAIRLGTRGGLEEVLAHPWFAELDHEKMLDKCIEAPVIYTSLAAWASPRVRVETKLASADKRLGTDKRGPMGTRLNEVPELHRRGN